MKRQTRIITLLVIDTVFFLVEIIVGYMVHSLALVADSFHMLNDVMSLIVALYAIKLAARQTTSPKYSYGWQRAEILGALINGVFLLALCLSIFLEAIQRFFEPQSISKPVLILAVGSAGLASNIIGLVLFHEHSHGHGGHSHSHGESTDTVRVHTNGDLESGQTRTRHQSDGPERGVSSPANSIALEATDEFGPIADILPEAIVRRASSPRTFRIETPSISSRRSIHRTSRQSFASADDIFVSPAANRLSIVSQAQEIANQAYHEETEDSAEGEGEDGSNDDPISSQQAGPSTSAKRPGGQHQLHRRTSSIKHDKHNHSKPRRADKNGSGGGHSHQNLNMRGVFLHVLGDALGNIGVIATALFIWLTDFKWRFYADPVISLVITAIIFSSALPLVKSASFILLQGVPTGISLDDVKEDILEIKGIENVHDLHIWQLSDVKMIASVHIGVNLPKRNRIKRYHQIAKAIRTCLHSYGIHSSTIQPEFSDRTPLSAEDAMTEDDEDTPLLLDDSGESCMFECVGGGACVDNRCCDGAKSKKGAGATLEGKSATGSGTTYGTVNTNGAKGGK